jgi:hypothetical protein
MNKDQEHLFRKSFALFSALVVIFSLAFVIERAQTPDIPEQWVIKRTAPASLSSFVRDFRHWKLAHTHLDPHCKNKRMFLMR